MIRYITRKTVCDDQITIAIIVEIGYQWRPAPVCLRYATHKTDFTESWNANGIIFTDSWALIQLKGIPNILIFVSVAIKILVGEK